MRRAAARRQALAAAVRLLVAFRPDSDGWLCAAGLLCGLLERGGDL